MVGQDPERDSHHLDLTLNPNQPLNHNHLQDKKNPSDLRRDQTTKDAQREHHLNINNQHQMTTGEDQLEPLICEGHLIHDVLNDLEHLKQTNLNNQRLVTTNAIDGAVTDHDDQPTTQMDKNAIPQPPLDHDH